MPDFWLNDPEEAKRVFLLLEATDWRWPMDVLLRQDESLLEDVLALRAAKGRLANTPGDDGGPAMEL